MDRWTNGWKNATFSEIAIISSTYCNLADLVKVGIAVMPAEAGIRDYLKKLDSRLRGNDAEGHFGDFLRMHQSSTISNLPTFQSFSAFSSPLTPLAEVR